MTKPVSHSLVQTLGKIPDFSGLDEETLLDVVGESINLFWKEGSLIFAYGDPADALFVVLSGKVVIRNQDGSEFTSAGPGSFFGEISMLLDRPHSKQAVADTQSEILVLPKESFERLLTSNPKLAKHFQDSVKRRDESADHVVAES